MSENNGFRAMRRTDRAIDREEAYKILEDAEYGIFTTINNDGYPFSVPVNYVVDENTIYLHSAVEGQKIENIKVRNKVCFTVVGNTEVLPDKFSTKYESVIAYGKARVATGDERDRVFESIIAKYSPGFEEKGKVYVAAAGAKTSIIAIDIIHMTGKARK